MEEIQKRPFYTPEEFRRDILRCSKSLCYEALKQGKIKSFRLGYRYFIPASEVERLSQLATAENNDAPKVDPDLW